MGETKFQFELLSALDLMKRAPETVPCIVDGFLPQVGMSMLCAKPKSGKSSLARQLSVSVAEGRKFLGWPVLSGDVVYVNLEGGKNVLGSHLRQLSYTETKAKIHVVDQRMPASCVEAFTALDQALAAIKPVLVVIDPVIKFLRLPDSDRNDVVSPALETLEGIARKHGTHIMVLAHGKKRSSDDVGDSPLGSTGFRAGTDTNIYLQKQGEQRIITTEQRWGAALEPTMIMWDEERGEMSLGCKVEELEQSKKEARAKANDKRIENDIFDLVIKHGTVFHQQIVKEVKGNTATVLAVLEQMLKTQKIHADGKGTKSDPKRYRLDGVPSEDAFPNDEHLQSNQAQSTLIC